MKMKLYVVKNHTKTDNESTYIYEEEYIIDRPIRQIAMERELGALV
jgi:hypothetical protein